MKIRFPLAKSWIAFPLFSLIVLGILVYSAFFARELKEREDKRIEILGKAIQILQDEAYIDDSISRNLIITILETNDHIPLIITDQNKKPILAKGTYKNIPEEIIKDSLELKSLMEKMERKNVPFEIQKARNEVHYIFYDNSGLLNSLRYYLYLLGFFIIAYLCFSYWFLRALKKNDEGFLWVGLAKETAHQMGTPLSSMIGWIEIYKIQNANLKPILEIEKDVIRLKTISERFSKIGSKPALVDCNLSETLQQNYRYLSSRISKNVNFSLNLPSLPVYRLHNGILMSWVFENLVKNAVDAMRGEGKITVSLYKKDASIYIDFMDTGCGLMSKEARNIFRTGYSTKKRGWGLGLSLAKRVVEDYHKGKIFIVFTEVGKGTTFRIKF
ncbi:MAG: HAMP domain-containing histidine kinase [Bergeyella sp.]|nr:HAMP domain-containing histidine kinase [Bergeyella sp.]